MTLPTVSDQGFTVTITMCGINFLSHLRGAPHAAGARWDDGRKTHANLGWVWEGGGGGRDCSNGRPAEFLSFGH